MSPELQTIIARAIVPALLERFLREHDASVPNAAAPPSRPPHVECRPNL